MTVDKDSTKPNSNFLYIKPILSLSESISKKNNLNNISKKNIKVEEDDKRINFQKK